jgi:hypothetical protein
MIVKDRLDAIVLAGRLHPNCCMIERCHDCLALDVEWGGGKHCCLF